MKKFIPSFFVLSSIHISFSLAFCSQKEEFPSLEWGSEIIEYSEDISTDHVIVLEYLFSQILPLNLLEFGVGEGTKFLLENCNLVTSLELIKPSQTENRYENFLEKYSYFKNWNPLLHKGSNFIEVADSIYLQKKEDPALYDGTYLLELKDICDSLFNVTEYDIALVNPGLHFRGDLINELFGRVDIIIAHDTNYGTESYGWKKISTPIDYLRIDWLYGAGTTCWIHKSRIELIQKLLPNYKPSISKKLRIFFPDIHHELTKSMALFCQYMGHTLVLPGQSFLTDAENPGPKLSWGFDTGIISKNPIHRPSYLKKNVEVLENDEIFSSPPDVVFVNCDILEPEIHSIYNSLAGYKIKLAYYSGNDNTKYNPDNVKNLVSADISTPTQYNSETINFAYWIPWIDWDSVNFSGHSNAPSIPSYLHLHYENHGFRRAQKVFEEYTANYMNGNYIFTLPERMDQDMMFQIMEESAATLHIKNLEGFGYTIIQSLAKGRPVFLKRSFSLNKKLMYWCIENETVLFFDDYDEFEEKVTRFLMDKNFRHDLQEKSAKQIRRIINNERQALIMENFLQNLY